MEKGKKEREKRESHGQIRRSGNLFPGLTPCTFEVVLSQHCPGSPSFLSTPPPHLFVQKMKEDAAG